MLKKDNNPVVFLWKKAFILGSSIHEIKVDGNLNIEDIVEHEDILLLNTVLRKKHMEC